MSPTESRLRLNCKQRDNTVTGNFCGVGGRQQKFDVWWWLFECFQ
jgi:hypothetical protein